MNKVSDWIMTLILALFNGGITFWFTDQLWRGVTSAIFTVGIVYIAVSVASRRNSRA